MAITLPHIEDSNTTIYLPPRGEFETFVDEEHYMEKVKEWGLSTTKKEFWYKEATHQRLVTITGYETYGINNEYNTIVVEFQDGNLTCIHPAYLKEMQSSSFGKVLASEIDKPASAPIKNEKNHIENEPPVVHKEPVKKEKKAKAASLVLPEEKVHFTAKVKQFALTWNNFNEENDEVIVLENVVLQMVNPIEVGLAWCSHSKTLKKLELVPGENLEFDGKIIKKKLAKGKDVEEEQYLVDVAVLYKVNNPSKIKKG